MLTRSRPFTTVLALFAAAAIGAPAARAQDKPAGAEKPTLRLGTLAPEGTPWADTLERFKERIEVATKGELKVRLYLNARAGDEPEMLQKIAAKKLTGGGFTSSGLAGTVPAISLLELPFLFESDAEADLVMDKIVRDDLAKAFAAKGLHLYIWAVNGWVDFGSTQRAVGSLADLKASKPYSRESTARRAFWTACGVEPQVVPVPEVPAALAAGKVDLYDTTPLFAASAQWFQATKHWTDSNHIYQPAAILFDLAWWNALPADVRKSLDDYAPELQSNARKAVRGLDAGVLEGFRKAGMQMHTLDAAQRAAMRDATKGVGEKLVAEGAFTKDMLDKVSKALAEARAARAAKPTDPVAEHLEAADRYSANRPKVSDLLRAEAEVQEALRANPKSFDATWRMARQQFYLGKYGPEERKIPRFETGIEWAKKAIALADGRAEGHCWLGVLYGVFGEAKGITSSLFLVGDMQKSLERANELDPKVDGAAPPRVLGRLFFKLPWAAGGSNKKSLEYLRQSMKLDPKMPLNYTFLAETLIDEDEDAEAKKLLQTLIGMTPDPKWTQEHKEAVESARKLLEKCD